MICSKCSTFSSGLKKCPICGSELKEDKWSLLDRNKVLSSLVTSLKNVVKKKKIEECSVWCLSILQRVFRQLSNGCEILIKKINGR